MKLLIFLFLIQASFGIAKDFNVVDRVSVPDISDSETGLDIAVLKNLTKENYARPNQRNPLFL